MNINLIKQWSIRRKTIWLLDKKGGVIMQLILDNIIPIKFYPYPHVVMKRLISSLPEYSNQSSKYIWYRKWLSELFNNAGIKNTIDNKIVFEVEIEGIHFFIGFYDWVMSIGFGIHKI